jgi:hypothetical protein
MRWMGSIFASWQVCIGVVGDHTSSNYSGSEGNFYLLGKDVGQSMRWLGQHSC